MSDEPLSEKQVSDFALDRSLRLNDLGEGRWQAAIDVTYGNGSGPFGGWVAALLLKSILNQAPLGEPLSLTVTFLGGYRGYREGVLGGATRMLRRGRSNEHWTCELSDSSGTAIAHAVASFGVRRPTVALGDIPAPAPARPPEAVPRRLTLGNVPPFFRRYDVRPLVGQPFRKNLSSESRAWVRDADGRPLDRISLAALTDTPVPRVFLLKRAPVPVATVTMSIYFHAAERAFAEVGADYVLVDAICNAGHDGFHDQSTRLWSRAGCLLATSEQLVWYGDDQPPAAQS